MKDLGAMTEALSADDSISGAPCTEKNTGTGEVSLRIEMPRALYYQTLSRETGLTIQNDGDLIAILSSMAADRQSCSVLREALDAVRETGYGVVYPALSQMKLEEPQIVRQNGKYSVRLRANAPAIHLMLTEVETEVSPAIGGESASEEIISFLLQGFDGDINRIWQSNIFGKSLYDIACESLTNKVCSLSENARGKLQHTLERIINEGSAGLICILL